MPIIPDVKQQESITRARASQGGVPLSADTQTILAGSDVPSAGQGGYQGSLGAVKMAPPAPTMPQNEPQEQATITPAPEPPSQPAPLPEPSPSAVEAESAVEPVQEGEPAMQVFPNPEKEQDFQKWYKARAKKAGISEDPDDPMHAYDYRRAFDAGVEPQVSPDDGKHHWDDRFKLDNHPELFVNGVDTRTGQRVAEPTLPAQTIPVKPDAYGDVYTSKGKPVFGQDGKPAKMIKPKIDRRTFKGELPSAYVDHQGIARTADARSMAVSPEMAEEAYGIKQNIMQRVAQRQAYEKGSTSTMVQYGRAEKEERKAIATGDAASGQVLAGAFASIAQAVVELNAAVTPGKYQELNAKAIENLAAVQVQAAEAMTKTFSQINKDAGLPTAALFALSTAMVDMGVKLAIQSVGMAGYGRTIVGHLKSAAEFAIRVAILSPGDAKERGKAGISAGVFSLVGGVVGEYGKSAGIAANVLTGEFLMGGWEAAREQASELAKSEGKDWDKLTGFEQFQYTLASAAPQLVTEVTMAAAGPKKFQKPKAKTFTQPEIIEAMRRGGIVRDPEQDLRFLKMLADTKAKKPETTVAGSAPQTKQPQSAGRTGTQVPLYGKGEGQPAPATQTSKESDNAKAKPQGATERPATGDLRPSPEKRDTGGAGPAAEAGAGSGGPGDRSGAAKKAAAGIAGSAYGYDARATGTGVEVRSADGSIIQARPASDTDALPTNRTAAYESIADHAGHRGKVLTDEQGSITVPKTIEEWNNLPEPEQDRILKQYSWTNRSRPELGIYTLSEESFASRTDLHTHELGHIAIGMLDAAERAAIKAKYGSEDAAINSEAYKNPDRTTNDPADIALMVAHDGMMYKGTVEAATARMEKGERTAPKQEAAAAEKKVTPARESDKGATDESTQDERRNVEGIRPTERNMARPLPGEGLSDIQPSGMEGRRAEEARAFLGRRSAYTGSHSGLRRLGSFLQGIEYDPSPESTPAGTRLISEARKSGYELYFVTGTGQSVTIPTDRVVLVASSDLRSGTHELAHIRSEDPQVKTLIAAINSAAPHAIAYGNYRTPTFGKLRTFAEIARSVLDKKGIDWKNRSNLLKAITDSLKEEYASDLIADRVPVPPELTDAVTSARSAVTGNEGHPKFAPTTEPRKPIQQRLGLDEMFAAEMKVPSTLTDEEANRMQQRLKKIGYNLRGRSDLLISLDKQKKLGHFYNEDWIAAYEFAKSSVESRKTSATLKSEAQSKHPNINRQRIRELGYTTSLLEAGYITPDGRLIDLSGKREGGTPNQRALDHREAGGTDGMQEFMAEGNVRMDGRSGSIDLNSAPTKAQESIIERMAVNMNGAINVDLENGLGKYNAQDGRYESPAESFRMQYETGTSPRKILNDIRGFFGQDKYAATRKQSMMDKLAGEQKRKKELTRSALAGITGADKVETTSGRTIGSIRAEVEANSLMPSLLSLAKELDPIDSKMTGGEVIRNPLVDEIDVEGGIRDYDRIEGAKNQAMPKEYYENTPARFRAKRGSEGGLPPDQMLNNLQRKGLMPQDATIDDLIDRLNAAAAGPDAGYTEYPPGAERGTAGAIRALQAGHKMSPKQADKLERIVDTLMGEIPSEATVVTPTEPQAFKQRIAGIEKSAKTAGILTERLRQAAIKSRKREAQAQVKRDEETARIQEAQEQSAQGIVGIKKDMLNADRVARGEEPIDNVVPLEFKTVWEQASVANEARPAEVLALIKNTIENPRALTPLEYFRLLHERVTRSNTLNKVSDDIDRAAQRNDEAEVGRLMPQMSAATEAMNELDVALRGAQTASGRSLSFLRALAAEDYSLATLVRRATAANRGKTLSSEQLEAFRKLAKEHKDALKKLQDYEAGKGSAEDQESLADFQKAFDKAVKDYTKANKGAFSKKAVENADQVIADNLSELKAMGFPTAENSEKYAAAFHGSPYDFEQFKLQGHVGTGEGAAAYGWGLYFAGKREVAEAYREQLRPPTEVISLKIGGVPVYSNGNPVDYSPSQFTNTPQQSDYARAKLQEDFLINDHKIREAFDEDGKNGARDASIKIIQDAIDMAKSDNPGDVPYLESVLKKAAGDVGNIFLYKKGESKVYHVELAPKEDEYLLWDKPLSRQSEKVKTAIVNRLSVVKNDAPAFGDERWLVVIDGDPDDSINAYKTKREASDALLNMTGKDLYEGLEPTRGNRQTSQLLLSAGIPGVKYVDQGSRSSGVKVTRIWENEKYPDRPQWRVSGAEGYSDIFATEQQASAYSVEANAAIEAAKTYNYVLFDDTLVSVKEKYAATPKGLDPAAIEKLANIGAGLILKGDKTVEPWSEKMRGMFGPTIEPHLKRIWLESWSSPVIKEAVGQEAEPITKDTTKVEYRTYINEETGEQWHDISRWVKALYDEQIESGLRDPEAISAAVTEIVKEQIPDITERDVREAFSDYGKISKPSMEDIDVARREIRSQEQKLLAIEDVLNKLAPLKTGPRRGEQSDKVRELTRQLHDLMKEAGITTTDPDRQLKSALDVIKKRLTNSIRDLDNALATGKRMVTNKKTVLYDTEALALKERRDELRRRYDEVFKRPELTDGQRLNIALKAAQQSASRWSDRVAEAEAGRFLGPKAAGKPLPKSDELDELRSYRDAMKAEYERLKELAFPKKTPEQRAVEARKKRLQKKLETLQNMLITGNYEKKPKAPPPPLDEETVSLKAEVSAVEIRVKEQIEQIRWGNLDSWQKSGELVVAVMDSTRNATLSFDNSALGNQGALLMLSHPIEWLKAAKGSYMAFTQEGSLQQSAKLQDKANWKNGLYLTSKLALNDPDGTGNFNSAEDNFRLNLTRNIPIAGKGIDISNRMYATAVNEMRTGWFDMLLGNTITGKRILENPTNLSEADIKFLRDIAAGINQLTGRGELRFMGKKMDAKSAAYLMRAPRFLQATFDILTFKPIRGGRPFGEPINREIQMAFAKEYLRIMTSLALIYALAEAFGVEIDYDPRSSQFGNIKFSKTLSWNPIAFVKPTLVFMAKILSGQQKVKNEILNLRSIWLPVATEGERRRKVPFGRDAMDVMTRFGQGKAHPAVSAFILSPVTGEDYMGNEYNLLSMLKDAFVPIGPVQMTELMMSDEKAIAAIAAVLNFHGFRIQQDFKKKDSGGIRMPR